MDDNTLRLRFARFVCPPTHRLIEADEIVTEPNMAANDLIRGGDALERGWGCSPAILYNGARVIRTLIDEKDRADG